MSKVGPNLALKEEAKEDTERGSETSRSRK